MLRKIQQKFRKENLDEKELKKWKIILAVSLGFLLIFACFVAIIIPYADKVDRCNSYVDIADVPASDYSVCKEKVAELQAKAIANEEREQEECVAKNYKWNSSENRCNTDKEQEEVARKQAEEEAKKAEAEKNKAEELARRKTECESKPYHTWNGSSCTAETWTKELGWSEVENNQCYVDAIYDKMDDRYGSSFDILGHYDGLDWSATEYYSGGTLTKTDVYFGYKFLKSGNLYMAKCEVKNCKCSSLESKG